MNKDIIIIGGGVVGCAVARLLSRYDASVAVLEGGSDVAEGASKANSGIVHAGFDAKPGSLKAKLNVEGANMYKELCAEVNAPYARPGAMVLAFTEEERPTIEKLYEQGIANGVPELRIIERDEIVAMEPAVNPDVVCALLVPTSGLTSPYELTCAWPIMRLSMAWSSCVRPLSTKSSPLRAAMCWIPARAKCPRAS